jgi:hypothetical protein
VTQRVAFVPRGPGRGVSGEACCRFAATSQGGSPEVPEQDRMVEGVAVGQRSLARYARYYCIEALLASKVALPPSNAPKRVSRERP